MKEITHIIGTKNFEGKPYHVVRNYFVYDSINWMGEANSEFTKLEKKVAKQQHKLYLKSLLN